jgi:Protein of unknown function (DUF4085)
MIFFTRKLQDGIQDDSGWTRRAAREWKRRAEIHRQYETVIAPLLPASVRRLCRETLHDAVVASVQQRDGIVTFIMDARSALGGFRGYQVRLTFSGVKRRIQTRGLVGQWWLYEEAHLSSRARFALHVLFHSREMEIEADELSIQRV